VDAKGQAISIDQLDAEAFSPLGHAPFVILDLADASAISRAIDIAEASQGIVIGVDRAGHAPAIDPEPFDCLFTTGSDARFPWVSVAPSRIEAQLQGIIARVAAAPIAAATCMRVLRVNQGLSFQHALFVESLAYSTLLGGEEFRRWRRDRPANRTALPDNRPYVVIEREDAVVTATLDRPEERNATRAGMRDALFEALANVIDDPSAPHLILQGAGDCFSTGGALDEFGEAGDLAAAHIIRTLRSCTGQLALLGERAEVILHGGCVGAGIEIGAAAARRRAIEGAFFQLPELSMGLMPGAGGTVSISRAIGRHRTAAMMLGGKRINTATALAWGLIHTIEPAR
jgi:hypothetical protein